MFTVQVERTFTVASEPVLPAPVRPPLWRVLHDRELGALWRPNLPEVHPFFPNHFVPFTKLWQLRSFAMNTMTRQKWRSVYSDDTIMTNNQGFNKAGDPRADYVNKLNLDKPLPKVEALVCGGAVLTGVVSGNNLIVHMLDGRKPPPVVIEPWEYFHAVTVDGGGVPRLFPQGNGKPVFIPLLADPTRYTVITFPLSKLRRLRDDEPIPSPYL